MRNILIVLFIWTEASSQNNLDIFFKLDDAGDWVTEDITVGTPVQPLFFKLSNEKLCLKFSREEEFSLTGQNEDVWGLTFNPYVSRTYSGRSERFGFSNQRFLTLPLRSCYMTAYSGNIDILNIKPLNNEYSTVTVSSAGSVMHVAFSGTAEDRHPVDHWFVPKPVWSWMGKTLPATNTLLNLGRRGIVFPHFLIDDLKLDDPERFVWYPGPSERQMRIREGADYSQFAPLLLTMDGQIFVIPWTAVGCRERRENFWCETKISVWTGDELYIEVGNMLLDSFDRLILDTRSRLVTLEGPKLPSVMKPIIAYRGITTFHPPVVFVDIYGRSWLRLYHSSVSLPVGLPLALPELVGSRVFCWDSDPSILFYHEPSQRAEANIRVRGACAREARWTNPRSLHERLLGFTIYKELQLNLIMGAGCTVTISKEENGRVEINFKDTLSPTLRKEPEEECSICFEALTTGNEQIRLECGHTFHVDCIRIWLKGSDTCPLCRADTMRPKKSWIPGMMIGPFLAKLDSILFISLLKQIMLLIYLVTYFEDSSTQEMLERHGYFLNGWLLINELYVVAKIAVAMTYRVLDKKFLYFLFFYFRMYFHANGYSARVVRAIQRQNQELPHADIFE